MDLDTSEYEKLFHNIHNLDIFQVKANLDLYSYQYSQNEDGEKLRFILKKCLLEEILKTDHADRNFFQTCLRETFNHLASVGLGGEVGYSCCLVGCKYQASRHRSFVFHLKRDHPNIKNITCNFIKICKRSFSGVDDLVAHLKQEHSGQPNLIVVDTGAVGEIDVL